MNTLVLCLQNWNFWGYDALNSPEVLCNKNCSLATETRWKKRFLFRGNATWMCGCWRLGYAITVLTAYDSGHTRGLTWRFVFKVARSLERKMKLEKLWRGATWHIETNAQGSWVFQWKSKMWKISYSNLSSSCCVIGKLKNFSLRSTIFENIYCLY